MTDNVDDGRYEIEPVSNIQPRTSPEEATTRWCEPCAYESDRRTEAVSYCPTCNALFCKACDDAHTRLPSSRHHEVIRGSEMPDSNADKPVKYPDCKIHPENHKDNYCATHGNIVCRLCAKKQHDKKCLIKSISDLCTEMGDCDIDNLKEDVNTVRDLVTDTTLTLDKNVNEIKLQNETLVQEVDEFRTNIVSKLDDLFSEMKSRINEHCAQQCLKHLQNMSFLSDVTDSLDQTLAEIDKVAKYTVEEHLFLRMQEIIEKMYRLSKNVDESIKQMQIVHLSFSPNKALVSFASSLSSLGDVKTEQMHSTSRPLPVANFPRLQLNIKPKSVKKLTSLNVKIPEDQYTCNIKGMAARNDGSLILPDYDNKRK